MWFSRFFNQATQIAILTRERNFFETELEKVEIKLALTEKVILAERKRVDKIFLTYADQISVKNGLYAKFEKAVESVELKKEEPKEISADILYAAEQNKAIDDANPDLESLPLAYYIAELSKRSDPIFL